MASKGNTERFVYITLPGQTEAVTAGRFQLVENRRGNAVGRFVYGKSYLLREDAVLIDPVELKLSGETTKQVDRMASLARCAMQDRTIGGAVSSRSMPAFLSSVNSTTC
ncbi:hypothetical protein J2R76_003640 [Bradyrhizobium sp. USDA 4532]|uniref:hypothetical protein n=1 Tax=unclassified Bradyrhizobium TaxID=2631580 RepID=UPI00209E068D|nr:MULTISPECIES: hypothetical protein [unclassified Bradyrhizobium]MCP1835303.1 hypothetical protein [Bradyrhizobium sp. USDA 4545]MCP1920049.1 hypothetical protein [Bradyrhizobium sp. USDA 4532]